MLVSTKGRYALRVMLELAQDDGAAYLPLPAIAERQGISEKYLESIISVLSKAGLVDGPSWQGRRLPPEPPRRRLFRGPDPAADRGLSGPRHLLGGRRNTWPPRRSLHHAPHVGKAGHHHQRLSGQRLPGRSPDADRRRRPLKAYRKTSRTTRSGRFLFFRSDSALVAPSWPYPSCWQCRSYWRQHPPPRRHSRQRPRRLPLPCPGCGPPGYRQPRPHRGSW